VPHCLVINLRTGPHPQSTRRHIELSYVSTPLVKTEERITRLHEPVHSRRGPLVCHVAQWWGPMGVRCSATRPATRCDVISTRCHAVSDARAASEPKCSSRPAHCGRPQPVVGSQPLVAGKPLSHEVFELPLVTCDGRAEGEGAARPRMALLWACGVARVGL
jgi:hypothetical protein